MSHLMIIGSSVISLTKSESGPNPFAKTKYIISSLIKTNPLGISYTRITRAAAIKDIKEMYSDIEEEQTGSLYELLGVSESVTLLEMKRAYKQLALKYHPDVSPPEQAKEFTRRFVRVQEAYETLSDPQSRARYDKDLANGLHLPVTRRHFHHDQKYEWRDQWESQLLEMQKRRMHKDADRNYNSWGARIIRQRSKGSNHNFE